jgi:LmbE family N-acetylglucosaminyl deacetylase
LPAGAFPDNALDSVPLLTVVKHIEAVAAQVQPDLVYTHHGGDLNVDHQQVCRAVLTAFRPQPGASVREIRTFEVPSSTEWSHPSVTAPFQPTLYVDVSGTWSAKEAALAAYAEELRVAPHARSLQGLDALSCLRGAQVGVSRAEAFCVLRRLVASGGLL